MGQGVLRATERARGSGEGRERVRRPTSIVSCVAVAAFMIRALLFLINISSLKNTAAAPHPLTPVFGRRTAAIRREYFAEIAYGECGDSILGEIYFGRWKEGRLGVGWGRGWGRNGQDGRVGLWVSV